MTTYDRIGESIKNQGLSRRRLAIKAGIPPSTFQSIMSRKSGMPVEMLQKIALALGVPEAALIYGHGADTGRGARGPMETAGCGAGHGAADGRQDAPKDAEGAQGANAPRFGQNALLCPRCGLSLLYYGDVVVYDKEEASGLARRTAISCDEISVKHIVSYLPGDPPRSRGGGLTIFFWCKSCERSSKLAITRLKSRTLAEWM